MQGISKEMLPRLMDKISDLCDNEDRINYYDIEKLLINECTELNPWLPIEQAPKDRPVLLKINKGPISCRYFVGNAYDSWPWEPTHYQELPEPPK